MKFHEIYSDNLNIIDAYDQNSVTIKNNTYYNTQEFYEKIYKRP